MKNPLALADSLQKALVQYLSTTFNLNLSGDPSLKAQFVDLLRMPNALFKGPYVELSLPYVRGASLQDLEREEVTSPELLSLPCFASNVPLPPHAGLYRHQEQAVRKIVAGRNVVVSSGTGSGKTEAFLLPLLNDLVKTKSPGVRALLIYPLNALVNDQLARLRRILKGTDITFGRYTSELENNYEKARENYNNQNIEVLENEVIAREQIRNGQKIPQLLITNYAMLEYLLLRPEDNPIFESGLWRFIILDEAHTYRGAQGIEVAMLLRRLKERLGKDKGQMQCIATSATLTNEESQAAVDFARNLFGEEFSQDDVIFGEVDKQLLQSIPDAFKPSRQSYRAPGWDKLLEDIQTKSITTTETDIHTQLQKFGFLPPSTEESLYQALQKHGDLIRLRQILAEANRPLEFAELAKLVFNDLQAQEAQNALYHLIELGASVREAEDKTSLFPARYHFFARAPQGIWVCLNPHCDSHVNQAVGLSAKKSEKCETCGCYVYPLLVCRDCGQVYIRAYRKGFAYFPQDNPYDTYDATVNFLWQSLESRNKNMELIELEEDTDTPTKGLSDYGENYVEKTLKMCLMCAHSAEHCKCQPSDSRYHFTLYRLQTQQKDSQKGTQENDLKRFETCPRCYSKTSLPAQTEIVTPLETSAVTILAVMTHQLYTELPPNPQFADKPGQGRKLLTFYDSRQGAARFAANIQETVISQQYYQIYTKALEEWEEEKGYPPNLNHFIDKFIDKAWDNHLIQNDLDDTLEEFWRDLQKRSLSKNNRETLRKVFFPRLLAQLTTRRKQRNSLESLAQLSVTYFESEENSRKAIEPLADELGLASNVVEALIFYLCDNLRQDKIITLPSDVQANHEAFGRNQGHLSLVRQGGDSKVEVSWIPATQRHKRWKTIEQFLRLRELPHQDEDVKKFLEALWYWLIGNKDKDITLLKKGENERYRLDYLQIYLTQKRPWFACSQCRRLYSYGEGLPCFQIGCRGHLELFDAEVAFSDNYFRQTYQSELIPLRAEEHTAQLSPEKGRSYQEAFQNGDINLLSCSTTFEMGIDLGDLQAVSMNNIPPTVANYRQRAGRAGRRASGMAFILTWAGNTSHDQSYFRHPYEIIHGEVRVPYLYIKNPHIRQRHVNALILSRYLRYLVSKVSKIEASKITENDIFFEAYQSAGNAFGAWIEENAQNLDNQLKHYARLLGEQHLEPEEWRREALKRFDEAKGRYVEAKKYYQKEIERLGKLSDNDKTPKKEAASLEEQRKTYRNLRDRLKEGSLIDYLSSMGILPNYAFPLYSVELYTGLDDEKQDQGKKELRLQRDLKYAIREYAPGAEVVADKRIWKSRAVLFERRTPQRFEYRLCKQCKYLEVADISGRSLKRKECPVCGQKFDKDKREYLQPDGFLSGKPKLAHRHVAPILTKVYSALLTQKQEEQEMKAIEGFPRIHYEYREKGILLYVNQGQNFQGYRLCMDCGNSVPKNKKECSRCRKTNPAIVDLGHRRETNILSLHLEGENRRDTQFWLSLLYALLQGAAHALQIERQDIDGVLTPRQLENSWTYNLVLFDDVPGGAGHMPYLIKNFGRVIASAKRVVDCQDCTPDTSCYHCLRDFNNQVYHAELVRGKALQFLESLAAS
jgi:superfamily II DNA or RNA helicase